eukprot:2998553-Alexandrium_andersonii.AAC.1
MEDVASESAPLLGSKKGPPQPPELDPGDRVSLGDAREEGRYRDVLAAPALHRNEARRAGRKALRTLPAGQSHIFADDPTTLEARLVTLN